MGAHTYNSNAGKGQAGRILYGLASQAVRSSNSKHYLWCFQGTPPQVVLWQPPVCAHRDMHTRTRAHAHTHTNWDVTGLFSTLPSLSFLSQSNYRQHPGSFQYTAVTETPNLLHAKLSNQITNEVKSPTALQGWLDFKRKKNV